MAGFDPTTNDGRALQRLLDELGRLPGIGPKSAQRIAYHLLEADAEEARRLSDAIVEVKRQVHFCPICFSYATRDTCDICADSRRDQTAICVVSEPRDVAAILRRKRIEYVVKREAVDHLRSPGLRLGFAFPLLLRL